MTKAPNKMPEITSFVANVMEQLSAGELDRKIAQEINNSAGKIIMANKIQIEYTKAKKDNPDLYIEFMEK